jgi:valyl-tRNA synthetase
MSPERLSKAYDPTEVEARWYPVWEQAGYFRPSGDASAPSYCIVLPPPNVTGSLHLGHALTATIQDVLIRWRRMQGWETLWLPGTDHAGIATQVVVERELQKEGLTRHDLGREAFVRRVWKWKEEYGHRITEQHKALGASLDWSRERFTMDERSSRAVREVFVRLYEEGLCRRAHRLINLCPRCHTALSDLEVEHEENVLGELFSFAYPFADGSGEIVVATTRPETMLGDTAVAVHPADPRYRDLVGKKQLRHPFLDRLLPIVGDDILVDPAFGTGAVKVTPAHDFNDFECGLRNNLPMVNIFTIEGVVNENGGPFAGKDRLEARQAVKEALDRAGLSRGTKPHLLAIGRCQRCNTVVEPYLSLQWFVDAEKLAKPALEAVASGKTRFVPESWTKTYYHWMENIKPWCVSRQLWWGHQIPAWYCPENHVTVAREDPTHCATCGSSDLHRDEDVLDTWFSSALWPFSTLGWPEETADLRRFYPNAVMETGFDILFFWVARMMMMGLYCQKEVPFRTVFLHAMIRDEKGEKMSKTRGNVIDPLDITRQYGADALRFTLAILAAQGRDIKLSLERVEGYRNFLNKLWNAARFVLLHLEGFTPPARESWDNLTLPDRWLLSRLAKTIAEVHAGLEEFRFNEAAGALYHFVWHELCDWYIEIVKLRLHAEHDPVDRERTQRLLVLALDTILKLLHPFIPFITEEIWQKLPLERKAPSLCVSRFPVASDLPIGQDPAAEEEMGFLMEIVVALRTIRVETGIPPGMEVAATILAHDAKWLDLLERHRDMASRLARVNPLVLTLSGERPRGSATAVVRGAEILVPLLGVIDLEAERRRLEKEIRKVMKEREACEKRLQNPGFIDRAPAEVVAKERERLTEHSEKLTKLEASLARLREVGS